MKSAKSFFETVFILTLLTYVPGCATVYSGVAHSHFPEKQKIIHSITVLPVDVDFQEKQGNKTEIPLYENMKTANKISEEEIRSVFQSKGYEVHFFKPSEEGSQSEELKKALAFYNEKLDKVFDAETVNDASRGWPVPANAPQANAYLFVREAGFVKAQDAQMAEAITQGIISGAFSLLTGYSSYVPLDPSSALMLRAVLFDPSGEVLWHSESPSLSDPRYEANIRARLKEAFGGFPPCVFGVPVEAPKDANKAKSSIPDAVPK